jgi:hypothetical protein
MLRREGDARQAQLHNNFIPNDFRIAINNELRKLQQPGEQLSIWLDPMGWQVIGHIPVEYDPTGWYEHVDQEVVFFVKVRCRVMINGKPYGVMKVVSRQGNLAFVGLEQAVLEARAAAADQPPLVDAGLPSMAEIAGRVAPPADPRIEEIVKALRDMNVSKNAALAIAQEVTTKNPDLHDPAQLMENALDCLQALEKARTTPSVKQ